MAQGRQKLVRGHMLSGIEDPTNTLSNKGSFAIYCIDINPV